MFIFDSLLVSGIQWTLRTIVTAAEAEMDDDSALREQLLEAEMRRELGDLTDDEFADIESDLLTRIREIKTRREGSGPLAFGAEPITTSAGSRFQVEASVTGDFYEPGQAPHTTVVESGPSQVEEITVMDIEPGDPVERSGRSKRSNRPRRSRRPSRMVSGQTSRPTVPSRTVRTSDVAGAPRTSSTPARPRRTNRTTGTIRTKKKS